MNETWLVMKCTGGEHRKKEIKTEKYSVNVSSFAAYQLYPLEAKQFFPNVANWKKKKVDKTYSLSSRNSQFQFSKYYL